MTILELIQAACRSAQVPDKHAELIQKTFNIVKEEGISAFVGLFKENLLPMLKDDDVPPVPPVPPTPTVPPVPPVPPVKPTDISPELKTLLETQANEIKALKDLVTNQQTAAQKAAKLESAKPLLKAAGIPDKLIEKWLNRINVDSDKPLQDQVNDLKAEYTELQQDIINKEVADGNYTPGGAPLPDKSGDEWVKVFNEDSGTAGAPGVADLGIK